MKGCERFRSEIAAYVAGEPSSDGWSALRDHLNLCTPCADECTAFRTISERMGRWEDQEVPSSATQRLEQHLRGAGDTVSRPGWARGLLEGVIAAGVLWGLGTLCPVPEVCAFCHRWIPSGTLPDRLLLAEFLAGAMFAIPVLLMVEVISYLLGGPGDRSRALAKTAVYTVLAAVGAPLVQLIAWSPAVVVSWGLGSGVGAAVAMGVPRLRLGRITDQ